MTKKRVKNETQNKTKHLSKYRPQSTTIPLKWIPYPSVRNLRKSKLEKIRHFTFFSPKNKPLEYFVLSLYPGRTFNSFLNGFQIVFLYEKRVRVAFCYLISTFAILLEWQFWYHHFCFEGLACRTYCFSLYFLPDDSGRYSVAGQSFQLSQLGVIFLVCSFCGF